MKKLFLSIALLLSLFAGVQRTQAQERVYQEQDNGRYHQDDRYQDRWRHNKHNRMMVRNEYRYVRYGRDVYKETYRCTYYRNGMLVNRQLIDREYVDYYNNDNRAKYRFNVFLRF